jgi:hypothetical protein
VRALIAAAALAGLAACSSQAPDAAPSTGNADGVRAVLDGVELQLEVADDAQERAVGLMDRSSVPPGHRHGLPLRQAGVVPLLHVPRADPAAGRLRARRRGGVSVVMPPCGLETRRRARRTSAAGPDDTVVETAPETLRTCSPGDGSSWGADGWRRVWLCRDATCSAAVRARCPRAPEDLGGLVRIPTILRTPRGDASAACAAARRGRRRRRRAGVAARGQPAVIATWPAPEGAPTVLLYAHLDVQPTGPEASGRARRSSRRARRPALRPRAPRTTRPGVLMHLAVLRAVRRAAAGRAWCCSVEGEEEIGSPTLPALLPSTATCCARTSSSSPTRRTPRRRARPSPTSLRGLVDLSSR